MDETLLAAALDLAITTARKIRQPVEHIVRRPRTQRYFLKHLRRSTDGDRATDDELREVIQHLEVVFPPPEITEPVTHPVWWRRVKRLLRSFPRAKLFAHVERARRRFGWHHELTLSVLLVAESEMRVILDGEYWRRRRPEDGDTGIDTEVNTMVTQAGTRRKVPATRIVKLDLELPCPLRHSDLVSAVERSAELMAEIDFTREELRDFKRQRREKLRKAEEALRKLSRQVVDKAETRAVKCEERFLYERGVVRVVRLDTGVTVRERPMLPEEYQLPFEGLSSEVRGSAPAKDSDVAAAG